MYFLNLPIRTGSAVLIGWKLTRTIMFFSFAHVIEEKYQNNRYFMFKKSDCEIGGQVFFPNLKKLGL